MARKRDRAPREPIPEEHEIAVPEEEPTPAENPQEVPGSVDEVIEGLLGPQPKPDEIMPDVARIEEENAPVADSVDGYIRSQVLKEMYGTENPSEYDRIQLALKRLL